MTVNSASNKITYAGNGATTSFSFSFSVTSASDIQVFFTDALGNITQLASNLYAVTINPAVAPNPTPIGGAVTYPLSGSAIAVGTQLSILRTLTESQPTSLSNQGTLWQPVVESGLDRQVMMVQQLQELIGRSIVVAVPDPTPNALPPVAQRANLAMGFDSSGNPIAFSSAPAGTISSAMAPVVAAATIAAAQALLGIQALGYEVVGAEKDFGGIVAPQTYFMEFGQAVSRAGFPELLAVICPNYTGLTITNGNAVITMPARADGQQPTTGLAPGMHVEASGVIPPNTTIQTLTNTTITLNNPPGSNGSTMRIFLYGNGDGSTTYNLPDGRGNTYAGMDPQNTAGRLNKSTAQGVDASGVGNSGGEQAHTITTAELAVHNHGVTDPTHTHTVPGGGGSFGVTLGAGGNAAAAGNTQTTGASATGITINNTGSGSAHNNAQPTGVRCKIIYAGRNTF